MAIKVSQEDEITMNSLISQVETAKAKEIAATRKVEEATEIINSLSIEVNGLKRKLKALEEKTPGQGGGSTLMQTFHHMNDVADAEVEELFSSDLKSQIPNYIDPAVANAATPFDKWKMHEFLYAPNTPAGSRAHDKHAVQMLLQASTMELSPDKIDRPTKSSISRAKRIQTAASPPRQSLDSSSPFFLGKSAEQSWGYKPTFDRENLGRINLWSSHDPTIPLPSSREKKSALSHSGPIKLKSLRVTEGNKELKPFSPVGGKRSVDHQSRKVSI